MPAWLEIPVFIHGITPEVSPLGHQAEYDMLFNMVQTELKALSKPVFTTSPVKVEWGWATGQSISADEKLAEAERWLTEKVTAQEKQLRGDWTFNPLSFARRWAREFLFYGIADMFYYVSDDGESTVRGRVFKFLANELLRVMAQENSFCSLTIFAHSGGAVIAHDWLYHLYRPDEVSRPKPDGEVTTTNIRILREMVERGKIRIRRLYTMGSPITPLALRSNGMITRLLDGQLLDPHAIGLLPSEDLPGPRWLNFLDKDDFFAYPLSFMYSTEGGKVIEDHFVDAGDTPISAHNGYWWSRDLARKIAFNF